MTEAPLALVCGHVNRLRELVTLGENVSTKEAGNYPGSRRTHSTQWRLPSKPPRGLNAVT